MGRVLVIFAGILIAVAQRSTVDISFGWRYALEDPSVSCPGSDSYPISLNNIHCLNLGRAPYGIDTAEDCEAMACRLNATVWQFCPANSTFCNGPPACWLGRGDIVASDCGHPGDGWIGAARNSTPPSSPWTPSQSQTSFDDSNWTVIDVPHDFGISLPYAEADDGGEAWLPRGAAWYRKHLAIPADWQGSYIELHVEGAFSTSYWWLNGVPLLAAHRSGYTPVYLRLDTVPGLLYTPADMAGKGGSDTVNVLTAFVDGSETTGWWYESQGITRKVWLSSTPQAARLPASAVRAPALVTGSFHARSTPSQGLWTESAVLSSSVEVQNGGNSRSNVTVVTTLYAADGATVVGTTSTSAPVNIAANTTVQVELPPMQLTNVELWSVARPYLYTLVATVLDASSGVPMVEPRAVVSNSQSWSQTPLDSVNVTIGVRDSQWDSEQGYFLNGQHVKMRGFCNHESIGGLGAVISTRLDLVRIQQIRGMGGNAWRTAHNAPEPSLLDLTDRLGVLVMDENRVHSTSDNCPGCDGVPVYAGDQLNDMIELVKRDRTHASVIWWSFCNEAGCGNGATEPSSSFRVASYDNDGSRFVGANMGWTSPTVPSNMSSYLDVMGFSHSNSSVITYFHEQEPQKPLVMSECCGCKSQRDEDLDMAPSWDPTVWWSSDGAECSLAQTQTSDAVPWMAGTFTWTAHDYYGEGNGWPHVSSSHGQFDLAMLPKAQFYWYSVLYRSSIPGDDPGRPPVDSAAPGRGLALDSATVTGAPVNTSVVVHIVENWGPPVNTSEDGRTIHVHASTPMVRLRVDGQVVAGPIAVPPLSQVNFTGVVYQPGSILTAEGLDSDGTTVRGNHTRTHWGAPAAIVLSLDAPNPVSGTGSAVYLDGHDVALIRATIVDSDGNRVVNASTNVTFTITAGPGVVAGVANGDPACLEPNAVNWRSAYHGLVRAFVRANIVASGAQADRTLAASINVDAGAGPGSATIFTGPSSGAPVVMTISASSPGLPDATLDIALSTDPVDDPVNVATVSVGQAYLGLNE